MSLLTPLLVFGKGVNKWLRTFSFLKALDKYFLVDWSVLLPSSFSYPWSWCRGRILHGHFHSRCSVTNPGSAIINPTLKTLIRENVSCSLSVLQFLPEFLHAPPLFKDCTRRRVFFRKVVTILKTETEIQSNSSPSIV